MKKDNVTKITVICFLYYLVLLLVNSMIEERTYLAEGSASSILSTLLFFLALEIFAPAVILCLWGFKKQGLVTYINNAFRYVSEHKAAYLAFLLALLFLQWNFQEGNYHIYGRVLGGAFDLPPSTSSRIFLFVYHYLFEEGITVVYLLLTPLIVKMTAAVPVGDIYQLEQKVQ